MSSLYVVHALWGTTGRTNAWVVTATSDPTKAAAFRRRLQAMSDYFIESQRHPYIPYPDNLPDVGPRGTLPKRLHTLDPQHPMTPAYHVQYIVSEAPELPEVEDDTATTETPRSHVPAGDVREGSGTVRGFKAPRF